MDENKLMMQFLSEELGTNDPKKIQNYLKGLDENKQKALATKYQQWKEAKKKKQATKAAHGAKLDYIKSLKHICPEGEELVYFKKGGLMQCGCVGKKLEKGDKVEKAASGAVARFKQAGKIKEDRTPNYPPQGTNKTNRFWAEKINEDKKHKNDYSSQRVKESEKDATKGITNAARDANPQNRISSNNRLEHEQIKLRKINNNSKPKEKTPSVEIMSMDKCGGAVKKFKKHFNGGKLF